MSSPTEVFYPFLAFSVLLLAISGIILIKKANSTKQWNLVLLGIANILTVVIFVLLVFTEFWVAINMIFVIAYLSIIVFVKMTFSTVSKKMYKTLVTLCLVLGCYMIFNSFFFRLSLIELTSVTRTIGLLVQIGISFPVFFWFSLHSFRACKLLKDKKIEPWILWRMKVNMLSALIMAFYQIPDILRIDPSVEYADPTNPISMLIFYTQGIIVMFFSISQFIAWVMPSVLKRYLNRNYEIPKDLVDSMNISESQIMKQLNTEEEHHE